MSNRTILQERPSQTALRPSTSEALKTVEIISIEEPGDGGKDFIARIDVLRKQAREELVLADPISNEQPRTFGFCATLFVFGQIVSLWALANGHIAPMVIGLLFSVAGAAFGIASFVTREPSVEPALIAEHSVDVSASMESQRFSA